LINRADREHPVLNWTVLQRAAVMNFDSIAGEGSVNAAALEDLFGERDFSSWNQISSWLRRFDGLRIAS